ncbi:hypothetical protein GMB80_11960 [Turicibacter sanguinis]|nr:hypothetical protein [Turicibacter sanguinis]
MKVPKSNGVIIYFFKENKEIEFSSYVEAAKYLNVGPWIIRGAITGQQKLPKKLVELGVLVTLIETKPVRKHKQNSIKKNGRRGTKVHALDLYTNEIIDTYNTVKEAAEDVGGTRSNITRACRGSINHAYGYKWEYADE